MEVEVVPSGATVSAKAIAGNMSITTANDKKSSESLLVNLVRIFDSPFVEVATDPPISTILFPSFNAKAFCRHLECYLVGHFVTSADWPLIEKDLLCQLYADGCMPGG